MTKTEFQREERYVVFKVSDLGNSLKGDEIRRLAREYAEQRRLKGKEPLECVVVEKDWPEYEPTWEAIEARVTGAQPAPSVPDGWQLVPIEPADEMLRAIRAQRSGARKGCGDRADWKAWLAAAPEAKLVASSRSPSVPEGFSREDLEAVADGLDGYEKTVNVGNVAGGGDDHLESTTAYAARFIRAMLAKAPEAKP